TPEITISTIFVEINQSKLRESGLSFSLFRGKDLNLGFEFHGSENVASPLFSATVQPTDKRLAVDINTALRMIESENLGNVISRPQVIVRAGQSGRVQVGQKFSIRSKDFSGNTIEQFYDVGTILVVTPTVFKVNDVTFIDLRTHVEKSSVVPAASSTIITTANNDTRISLLNGEESYVAGLYSDEESSVREGVPFLKDLPWWFFGLRYLFGYDSHVVTRKELLVILKAELLPLLIDRAQNQGVTKSVEQQKREEIQKDIDKRKASFKRN
ncbi:MAG: hypothetical protein HY966_06970, partial [Ignavibacteriales bacterium]|nr:hypothetical protein [Ignavibacteriales bacterium]